MLSHKRISLLLAVTLVATLLAVIAATLSRGQTTASATQKITVLRRKDQLKLKPTAAEFASLRSQLPKEERVFEDRLPKYLPIKVKIRAQKENAFKDLDNENWARDLEIEVKNTGNRPIYYFVLILWLPEAQIAGGDLIFDLRFGDKKFMNFASGAKPDDVSLKPGETCFLKIKDALDVEEHMRREEKWPAPKQIVLKFQELSFADGTGFRSSYDGPWPPPRKQPGLGACLKDPGPYTNLAKENHGERKFALGGMPASYLPAKFFGEGSSLVFLGSTKLRLELDDPCCPSGCQWVHEYDSDVACAGHPCESTHQADDIICTNQAGNCAVVEWRRRDCHDGTGFWGTTAAPLPTLKRIQR